MQIAWGIRSFWLIGIWLVWCAYGISWKSALVLLLGACAVVAVVVLGTFLIAASKASLRPSGHRLGVAAWLWLHLREIWVSGRLFLFSQVLPHRSGRNARVANGESQYLPVLLIHGYVNNEAAMASLWKHLSDKGFQAFTHTMEPVFGSIERYRDGIDARIAEVLRLTGAPKVNVIVHSMGGLGVRAWARSNPDHATQIAKLITLGTPHQGTLLAHCGFGSNGTQMRLDSPWWRALPPVANLPFPVTSIYTYDDNIVSPQSSSEVAGAKWLAFSGLGHLALLSDAKVQEAVIAEL